MYVAIAALALSLAPAVQGIFAAWIAIVQSSTARQHRGYVRGERVNTAGLKEFQVLEMRRLFAEGCTPIEIAAKFGISKSNSYQVLSNATWKHLLPSSAGI